MGQMGRASGAQKWARPITLLLAFGTGFVLHLLHLGGGRFDTGEFVHWLRDGSLAVIPAGMVVFFGLSSLQRLERFVPRHLVAPMWAIGVGIGYAATLVPGAFVHAILEGHSSGAAHLFHDAAAGLPFAVGLVLAYVTVRGVPGHPPLLTAHTVVASARRSRASVASAFAPTSSRLPGRVRWTAALVSGAMAVTLLPPVEGFLGVAGLSAPAAAAEVPAALPCNAETGTIDREYSVVAVNVILPFNRWGDVDRHGQIYVLEDDKEAVTKWMYPLGHPEGPADDRRVRPRPLVLRANEGECVKVKFKNDLEDEAPIPSDDPLRKAARPNPPLSGDNEGLPTGDQFASIHIHGASYDVQTSDGGNVGFNDDTTVGTTDESDEITYYWRAPAKEGIFFFHDHATVAGSEADAGSNGHGLWGALAVEPPGSEWYDPVSGAPLYSDKNAAPTGSAIGNLNGADGPADTSVVSGDLYLDAIIDPASSASFREFVQLSQDEVPGDHLQNCDLKAAYNLGVVPNATTRAGCSSPDPLTNAAEEVLAGFEFGMGLGFNYGIEPLLVRQEPINRCPDCLGEETWLSSWPYGDPGMVKLASGLGPWYPTWHPWYPGNNGEQNPGNPADPEDCGLQSRSPLLGNSCYTSNVVHAYQYDQTKLRFLHAGPKETHVFHLHAHQWPADPFDIGNATQQDGSGWPAATGVDKELPEATTVDSQSYGPGEGFTADLLFGAGSRPGTIGDSIFHCHLYPHFAEGFWSLFRTHDVIEDGTGVTPDGIKVRNVQKLPDDPTPDEGPPTETKPGFPRFVPGEFGWRAPQPIGGVWEPNGATDDPATSLVREDLDEAIRVVAGQALDYQYLNQIQTVDVSATGGTYTLTYRGETTGPIQWNVNPESALESLSNIADVTVSAVSPSKIAWKIAFADPQLNVTLLSADGTELTTELTDSTPQVTVTSNTDDPNHPYADLIDGLVAEDANTGGATINGVPQDRSNAVIPGAPVVDPCPAGARQVTYNVSAIQTDIVYNEAGWHDTQGRYYVLTEDVPKILSGEMEPEPFFFRANPGDCVNFNLTNQMPNYLGNDDFLQLIQTNMIGQHIHLVKFDVMASDGSSNGWNYQQAAFSEDQMLFQQSLIEQTPLRTTASAIGRTGEFDHYPANGEPARCTTDTFVTGAHVDEHPLPPDGAQYTLFGPHIDEKFSGGVMTSNDNGCRIALPEWFNPLWQCGEACPVGQTIRERWYVDYELRTVFTHDHHFPAEDQNRGLFGALVVEPTGMDVRNSFTGEFYQPINEAGHGPICGSSLVGADVALRGAQGLPPGTGCEANAVGTHLDIIGPGASDDFREFSLAVADFVSLYRDCQPGGTPCSTYIPGQEPLAAPEEPEAYPDDDPGIFGLNYRNAPLLLRNTHQGQRVDPAYWFSSRVHGDPKTPLHQAYAGDPVRYRVIQGAQEEQHRVQVHGNRWRFGPDDPGSPLVDSQTIGISEAFNFEIPQMECGVGEDCFGDYLYSSTSTDDLWLGNWGIMRVFGKGVQNLLPLPDNVPQAANGNTNFAQSGTPPPKANKPGNPCGASSPIEAFDVVAVDARVTYNEAGDHDPYGLVYAVVLPGESPEDAAARVRAGNPSPMVLHVNEGDCVEVTLHNMIDPAGAFAQVHAPVGATQAGNGFDAPLVLEGPDGTPAGLRVSLHASLLRYDVRGSDGATIGFNRDQTVGPGESILYRWWADDVTPGELGAINLTDYGDVRGHRHHGLFAGLVVHPANATVHDPLTGASIYEGAQAAVTEALEAKAYGALFTPPLTDEHDRLMDEAARMASGEQVDVRIPGRDDYRNWTVFFQDGLNLWDAGGANLPDQFDHPGELPDAEDRGEKGFNYRNASFHHRFGQPPGVPHDALPGTSHRDVFDSDVHGDPLTPTFRAYQGDSVRIRVLQGADKPRQHSFNLSGHAWYSEPFDDPAETAIVGLVGGISVGTALNIHVKAGGATGSIGDHRYNCGLMAHHESGGLWGIARVYGQPTLPVSGAFVPNQLLPQDNPFTPDYSPIMPLELVEIRANAWDDADLDGAQGDGELPLGRSVNGDPVIQNVSFQLHEIGADGTPGASIGDPADTAADGAVSFSVVPGAYTVKATVPDDWRATTLDWFGADASIQGNRPSGSVGLVQLGDVTIGVFSDIDNDGVLGSGENRLAGWTVTLSRQGETWAADTSADTGQALIEGLDPGTYQADVTAKAGRESSTTLPFEVVVAENASLGGPGSEIDVGFHAPSGFRVHLFNDADGDGLQDPGESNKVGWEVSITPLGGSALAPVVTDATGVADFGDVDPGEYEIAVAYPADWSLGTWSSERLATDLATGTVTDESSVDPVVTCSGGACTFVVYGPDIDASSGEPTESMAHLVTLGAQNPNVTVVAELFNDFDNDGVRDPGERNLPGWKAELLSGTTPVAEAVTGSNGRATFYFEPVTAGGTANTYTVRYTQPDDADPPWAPTPATSSTPVGGGESAQVSVIAGESVAAPKGFIQLGALDVVVFHDLDGDRVYDADEPTLLGRTVNLLSKNGQSVLATKVTGSGGSVGFGVAPGTDYQVEIVVPEGWVQTTPLGSNGDPTTRVRVTTVSDPTNATNGPDFGMWQSNDTTPPPDPTFNPPSGEVKSGSSITISSESGSTIWYTTDGTDPDPANGLGTPTASPASVQLNGSADGIVIVKAVAVDGSGNRSGIASATYTLTGTSSAGETRTVAPTAFTVEKGVVIGGGVSAVATDNGLESGTGYLQLGSTRQGRSQVIRSDFSATAQTGTVTDLTVTYDAIASTGGLSRTLRLWDFVAGVWVTVDEVSNEGTSPTPPRVITISDPMRFVSGTGEIRFRVETTNKSGHELWIDQLVATVTTS